MWWGRCTPGELSQRLHSALFQARWGTRHADSLQSPQRGRLVFLSGRDCVGQAGLGLGALRSIFWYVPYVGKKRWSFGAPCTFEEA